MMAILISATGRPERLVRILALHPFFLMLSTPIHESKHVCELLPCHLQKFLFSVGYTGEMSVGRSFVAHSTIWLGV